MIGNIANITTTALQNASKTLEVSANNIANIQTQGQIGGNQDNGKPYVARRVESTAQVEGGVSTQVKDKTPGTIAVPDADSPLANADGLVAAPNVNLEEEVVNQQFASYQFDASLKVLETADELAGSLLDVTA